MTARKTRLILIGILFLSSMYFMVSCETPPDSLCIDVDCGANGICVEGICECDIDYVGDNCEINLNDGLVAYYPLNGNLNDESGNDRNGTVNTTQNWVADKLGNPNSAFYLDGNGYISTPNNLNNYESVTVSFYFNLEEYPGPEYSNQRYQLVTNDIGNFGRVVNLWGAREALGECINTTTIFTSSNSTAQCSGIIPVGEWIFYTAIWTESYTRLYIDGELSIDETGSIDGLNDGTNYDFGNYYPNGQYAKGIYDDVRIYNRAFSEAEIQALYNQ